MNGEGVEQNYTEAREYYERAIELGVYGSLSNLGTFYHKGQGVKQNYAKAKEYYEKAAELGDHIAFFNLGLLYEFGKGVNKDYSKAKEYYVTVQMFRIIPFMASIITIQRNIS